MHNIKKTIFKTAVENLVVGIPFHFSAGSDTETSACDKTTYPVTWYADSTTTVPFVLGITTFYADINLTVPLSLSGTAFWRKCQEYSSASIDDVLHFNSIGVYNDVYTCSSPSVPVYIISDCVNGSFYSTSQSFSYDIGDIVEFNNGSGNPLPRCGTIIDDSTLGVPNATLTGLQRDCGDNIHCDLT